LQTDNCIVYLVMLMIPVNIFKTWGVWIHVHYAMQNIHMEIESANK
jgi:hypothetical protein